MSLDFHGRVHRVSDNGVNIKLPIEEGYGKSNTMSNKHMVFYEHQR